jgi:hypothetical protein
VPDRVLRTASLLVFLAALLGKTAPAWAAPEPTDRLFSGASACPTPAAVRAEVETLVPRERLNARLRGAGGSGATVEVIDLGVPFRVVAAGNTREYRDDARDCAHRARIAAVFVVLVVDPAAILKEVAAPPSPSSPPPGAPPAAATTMPATAIIAAAAAPATTGAAGTSRAGARVRVGLGAAVEGGLGSGAGIGQLGVALRLGFGAGTLALSIGAAALAPVDASIGGVRLRHRRIPADASVRAQGAVAIGAGYALQPYAELGVGVAQVQESALDLASPLTRTTIELGVHGGAGVYLAGSSRLTPFLALQGELVPVPPSVSALPRGEVGHTPSVWLGANAGVAWGWP